MYLKDWAASSYSTCPPLKAPPASDDCCTFYNPCLHTCAFACCSPESCQRCSDVLHVQNGRWIERHGWGRNHCVHMWVRLGTCARLCNGAERVKDGEINKKP